MSACAIQFNSVREASLDKWRQKTLGLSGAYDFIAENKRIAIVIAESQSIMERKRYRSFDSPGKSKFQCLFGQKMWQ